MQPPQCPHCKNDDKSLIEVLGENDTKILYRCEVCTKYWTILKKKGKRNEILT